MNSHIPEVALQGIEFWSTICDDEIDLAIDVVECMETGQPPTVSSMFYAKGALRFIAPPIMKILALQVCQCACVCLLVIPCNDIVCISSGRIGG